MKKLLIILALGCLFLTGHAQQQNDFSLFNRNGILFNPGMTGMEGFLDLNMTYRNQWTGFENAPSVYGLSGHGKIMKSKNVKMEQPYSLRISDIDRYARLNKDSTYSVYSRHAFGGYMIYDDHSPFQDLSVFATYAYHLPLSRKLTWSFGVGVGGTYTDIDQDLTVLDPNDPLIESYNDNLSDINIDIHFGTVFYTSRFYVAYSSNYVGQNDLFETDVDASNAKFFRHHYLSTGYRIHLTPFVEMYPSILAKYVDPAPVKWDAALKFRFYKKFTAGALYSNEQTIGGMIGLVLNNNFNMGYVYNHPYGDTDETLSPSHEITIGVKVWNTRNRNANFMW